MGPPPFLSQANVLRALLNKSLAPAKGGQFVCCAGNYLTSRGFGNYFRDTTLWLAAWSMTDQDSVLPSVSGLGRDNFSNRFFCLSLKFSSSCSKAWLAQDDSDIRCRRLASSAINCLPFLIYASFVPPTSIRIHMSYSP